MVTNYYGEVVQDFEHMFSTTHCSVLNGGNFVNNEHIDVYVVSLPERIPLQDYVLQESEVAPNPYPLLFDC